MLSQVFTLNCPRSSGNNIKLLIECENQNVAISEFAKELKETYGNDVNANSVTVSQWVGRQYLDREKGIIKIYKNDAEFAQSKDYKEIFMSDNLELKRSAITELLTIYEENKKNSSFNSLGKLIEREFNIK